jgi:hypothetical protein
VLSAVSVPLYADNVGPYGGSPIARASDSQNLSEDECKEYSISLVELLTTTWPLQLQRTNMMMHSNVYVI